MKTARYFFQSGFRQEPGIAVLHCGNGVLTSVLNFLIKVYS